MAFPEGGRGRGASPTRGATASSASAPASSPSSRCAPARRSSRARSSARGVLGSPTACSARAARLSAPAAAAAGACPRPARWRIDFGEPLASRHRGADAAEDRALVLELGDDVRARLQEKVYDSLVNREGAL